MVTRRTYTDVYFVAVEDDGFERLFCLYAHLSRHPSNWGHFLAQVLIPDSDELIFFDSAADLHTLRVQLNEAIGRAGELVFCYRDEPIYNFEWYVDT